MSSTTRQVRRSAIAMPALLAVAGLVAAPLVTSSSASAADGQVALTGPAPHHGCDAGTVRLAPRRIGGVFLTDETVRVRASCIDGDRVSWTLTDFWGKEVSTGSERVSRGAAEIEVHHQPRGHLVLTVQALDDGDTVAAGRTELAVVSEADREDTARFAVQTHFGKIDDPGPYPLEIIPLIKRLGVSGVRDSVRWEFVEEQKGTFRFDSHFSRYTDKLEDAGLDPLLTLGLFNANYDDGNTPYTEEGLAGFGRYAEEIIKRYGDRIAAVEVWNEPNGQGFSKGPAARDPVNYARMVERVSAAVREETDDVPVFAGATTGIPLPWLDEAFDAGALAAADGVSVHHYPIDATSREGDLAGLQDLIAQHTDGGTVPVWATETGWPTFYPRDEAVIARDLPKLLAIELASGVDRVFWFNFMNNLAPPAEVPHLREVHFGLIRSQVDETGPYSPKPGFATYATLIRQLADAQPTGRDQVADGVRSYAFADRHREVRIMWAGDGNRNVSLAGRDLKVVDMMGNPVATGSSAEPLVVKLTNEPVYVRGDVESFDVLPIRHEAETLPARVADGTTRESFDDPGSSGGRGDKYNGTQAGDFIEYDVPVPAPGRYDVIASSRLHTSRGIYQLSADGADLGSPRSQYGGGGNRVDPIASAEFDQAGVATLRLTTVGKDAASTDHTLAFDYLELVPADTRRGVRMEAEALHTTAKAAGTTEELFRDTAMSGTYGHKYNGHAVGDFVEYEVEIPEPGTYTILTRAKAHGTRGTYQLAVGGADQGAAQDYQGGCCYPTYNHGTKTFAQPGPVTLRFTATGKNAASTDYTLALDYLELVPEPES